MRDKKKKHSRWRGALAGRKGGVAELSGWPFDSRLFGNERKMTYNLLLGTAEEILVHFGTQVARVAVAPHQVINVSL